MCYPATQTANPPRPRAAAPPRLPSPVQGWPSGRPSRDSGHDPSAAAPAQLAATPKPAIRWKNLFVQHQRISGHSPYEPVFGFSRAIVVGDRVLVGGTAPIPPGGGPAPSGAYNQARLCLDLIGAALAQAGSTFDDVVRTRIYITDASHWEEVARAHGEVFAGIMPVTSAVIVAGLLDPAWLVEIEAEAVLPA